MRSEKVKTSESITFVNRLKSVNSLGAPNGLEVALGK